MTSKLDYGCSVDLIYTTRYPRQWLIEKGDDGEAEPVQPFLPGMTADAPHNQETSSAPIDTQSEKFLDLLLSEDLGAVPQDDYRAIRRAILDFSKFEAGQLG